MKYKWIKIYSPEPRWLPIYDGIVLSFWNDNRLYLDELDNFQRMLKSSEVQYEMISRKKKSPDLFKPGPI